MLTPDEAWQRIAAHLDALPAERLARRAAHGQVLAEPLVATTDVPAADVSAMDGYAVAGAFAPGDRLPVDGAIFAGDAPGRSLAPGRAARIMTGAPVPAGADRVVPVEATDGGTETVELRAAAPPGDHIRRRGEVQREGDVILPAEARLTPGALALAATHGYAELSVHRLPVVAVLATGDEVVPPDCEPGPGQLRDSHTDFLLAAGASLGLQFKSLGIAPDREAVLAERLSAGLAGTDVLIVCGGVSMGEMDLVEGVLSRLGCRRHVEAVAIQPGKPMVFATHPGGAVFGLPGNPASVLVDFWLFVRPALALLAGRADTWWPALAAILAAPLPGAAGRDRFLAAEVDWFGGGATSAGMPIVHPLAARGSHDLATYARGAALVRVRAGAPPAPEGARCEILPLPPPTAW